MVRFCRSTVRSVFVNTAVDISELNCDVIPKGNCPVIQSDVVHSVLNSKDNASNSQPDCRLLCLVTWQIAYVPETVVCGYRINAYLLTRLATPCRPSIRSPESTPQLI
ncbi:hypothetical protein TNCV_145411 [Trichonephila clavipes]|nr:hypothetical protein TNCV_145411 [Trichonephila clavipes]